MQQFQAVCTAQNFITCCCAAVGPSSRRTGGACPRAGPLASTAVAISAVAAGCVTRRLEARPTAGSLSQRRCMRHPRWPGLKRGRADEAGRGAESRTVGGSCPYCVRSLFLPAVRQWIGSLGPGPAGRPVSTTLCKRAAPRPGNVPPARGPRSSSPRAPRPRPGPGRVSLDKLAGQAAFFSQLWSRWSDARRGDVVPALCALHGRLLAQRTQPDFDQRYLRLCWKFWVESRFLLAHRFRRLRSQWEGLAPHERRCLAGGSTRGETNLRLSPVRRRCPVSRSPLSRLGVRRRTRDQTSSGPRAA
jgi:hypothetical protein